MYKAAFEVGLTPSEFWGMTLREYTYHREGYMARLSSSWDQTASIMALIANVNSAKGKNYQPSDFNPFAQSNQGVSSKQEAMELLEKLKDF